jgi:hypothetical protein
MNEDLREKLLFILYYALANRDDMNSIRYDDDAPTITEENIYDMAEELGIIL